MPILQALTYLAQVRQQPRKSERLVIIPAFTMHPFLLTRRWEKGGQSRKETVIIGTVRAVGWVGLNLNMGAWWRVAENWPYRTRYSSLRSHAKGRK